MIGSPTGLDFAKLKGWARTVSRTTAEQVNKAKDSLMRKAAPVENDPLAHQRLKIDAVEKICEGFRRDVEQLIKVSRSFEEKEATSVHVGTIISNNQELYSPELLSNVGQYVASHGRAVSEVRTILANIESLLNVILEKLRTASAIKKHFDSRDKINQKMIDEEKKWQLAMQSGDPKTVERRSKAQAAAEEMDYVTLNVKEESTRFLEDSDIFVTDIFQNMIKLQQQFYGSLANHFTKDASSQKNLLVETATPTATAMGNNLESIKQLGFNDYDKHPNVTHNNSVDTSNNDVDLTLKHLPKTNLNETSIQNPSSSYFSNTNCNDPKNPILNNCFDPSDIFGDLDSGPSAINAKPQNGLPMHKNTDSIFSLDPMNECEIDLI